MRASDAIRCQRERYTVPAHNSPCGDAESWDARLRGLDRHLELRWNRRTCQHNVFYDKDSRLTCVGVFGGPAEFHPFFARLKERDGQSYRQALREIEMAEIQEELAVQSRTAQAVEQATSDFHKLAAGRTTITPD